MGVLSMLNDAKIPFPINCVDNELLLEVRDPFKNKIHRTCKTLFDSIDIVHS